MLNLNLKQRNTKNMQLNESKGNGQTEINLRKYVPAYSKHDILFHSEQSKPFAYIYVKP